ncbi:MAG TPA: hypothetical protein VMP01_21215 [Pirellulaceae bacterium]|nr:hypothetical protein [Pirellulaceae bacterium]
MPLLKLQNLAPALRRHWTKSVSVAAAAALLTLVGLKCLPPQYASEAKLLVTSGGSNDGETPDWVARERNSIAKDLANPDLLARVVQTLGPQIIAAGRLPDNAAAQHAKAVQVLSDSLTIAAADGSGQITIRATTNRPELAEKIVSTLVGTYLPDGGRTITTLPPSPRSPPVLQSTADEAKTLEHAWKTATARLRVAQDPPGEISLAGQRKLIEDQLAEVEVQLLRELSKHEAEERRLAAQLTPAHPQLVALREMIGQLSQQINESGSDNRNAPATGSPSEKRIPGVVGVLCQLRQELKRELVALNQQEGLVAQATQDAELAEARLKAYAERRQLAQAQTAEEQHHDRPIELTVVQFASPARQTGGIQPYIAVTCGVLVGLLAGIGVALWCYDADPLLLTRGDVERLLELAVTGPIPTEIEPLDVAV